MFLKPSGKQIIVETLDGDYKNINIKDIYKVNRKVSSGERGRIDIKYGSANYIFILNTQSFQMDWEVLECILMNLFVDTRNQAYEYELPDSVTWEQDDLIKHAERKQVLSLFHWPNKKTLS